MIPIIDFDKFILSSDLQDNNDFEMKLTIPYTKSNEILFRLPYEDVIIDFDDIDYTFKIISDGITYDETNIYIRCVHAISEKLNAYMTATYNVADYNPITAVMELLDDYNIDYNNYAFQKAKTFFTGINETMDIVFISEPGNKMRLCDFLTEILKRLACVLVIDYKNNEVTIHNFIDTPVNSTNEVLNVGVGSGLVGHYPLKSNANDYSGNGYNGTVSGALLSTNRFSEVGSYIFDGTDDYINLNRNLLTYPENFTISCWVYNDVSGSESYVRIFDGGYGGSTQYGFAITGTAVDQSTSYGFYVRTTDDGLKSISFTLADLTWIHLVCIKNGTNIQVYGNGVYIGENTLKQSEYRISKSTNLGGIVNNNNFKGKIDDVRIYNRALTINEIAQIYTLTSSLHRVNQTEFETNILARSMIDKTKVKIDLSKDYYNSFTIGVYPELWAVMVYDYIYEVEFKQGTINVNERDLTIVGITATLKYAKVETVGGVETYFLAGDTGILTGTRTVSNSYLDDATVYLGQYSSRVLYGTPTAPIYSEWKDEKSNSDYSCVRHTTLEGATKIGNYIVQRYWRKRKTLEVTIPKYIDRNNGSYISYEGVGYVLISQSINKDKTATILLEEVLSVKQS